MQELLAPSVVQFFSQEGTLLGDKTSLEQLIIELAGIATPALCGAPLDSFGVEDRFTWAKDRQTTREEVSRTSLYCMFTTQNGC